MRHAGRLLAWNLFRSVDESTQEGGIQAHQRHAELTAAPGAMMVIKCSCGEAYHAGAENRGAWLRCRCGRIVQVPQSFAAARGDIRAAATRWLTPLSWGYVAIAVIACAILWTLSDRWWPATAYLFGPRWVLLLPLAVLLPAAVALRRRLLAPLIAAAVIGIGPTMGLRIGWRSLLTTTDTSASLRVVTLNARGATDLPIELPFRVEHWRADIVALQECTPALGDAVQRLAGWHSHVGEGLCLVSRYPIREASVMTWQDLAAERERGVGGSSRAAKYVIDSPQGSIRFANVHLETPRKGFQSDNGLDLSRLGENTSLRAEESRRTREWLGTDAESAVIVGDFNMPVESAIYRRDWSDFRNAFSEVGTGFGMTRNEGWIKARIDHVLTGSSWRPKRAVAFKGMGLDHRPVIADLELAPGVSLEVVAENVAGEKATPSARTDRSRWPNEPAGLTPLTDVPWNRLTNLGWEYFDDDVINLSIVSDSSAPRSPSNVYQHRFPVGWPAGTGGAVSWYRLAHDELFVGMYFKHSANWEQPLAQLSKLFYVFQRRDDDRQATFMTMAGPTGGPYTLQISNEPDGGAWWKQNVSDIQIVPGNWYRLEIYYKKASVSWSGDGIVRWWIDGVLAAEHTSARLRGEAFSEFHLNPVWGGGGTPSTRDINLRFDHIYISGR